MHLSLISVSLATLFETAVEPKSMIVMSVMPYGLNVWLDLYDESVDSSPIMRLVSTFPYEIKIKRLAITTWNTVYLFD